jgi:predicted metal-dependent phosphoesterase TrpH
MSRVVTLDPHVHTRASYDSEAAVEAVLASASDADLDAVAITDHDTMAGARRAMERGRAYGVVVVPGVEVSTADGHLLALGIADRPDPGQSLADTVGAVRDQGGAAVVPHPFQRSRHGVRRSAVVACDGIEVYNAMAMTGVQNRRAAAFARRHDYPTLGGSDAHTAAMVGRAVTRVELATATEPLTADAIVSAVRAGRTDDAGRRAPITHYVDKYLHNLRLRTAAGLSALAHPSR